MQPESTACRDRPRSPSSGDRRAPSCPAALRSAGHLQQLGLVVVAVCGVDPDAKAHVVEAGVLEDVEGVPRPGRRRCGRRRPCPRTSRGWTRRRRESRAVLRRERARRRRSASIRRQRPQCGAQSCRCRARPWRRRRSAARPRWRPEPGHARRRRRSRVRSSSRSRPRSSAPRLGACTSHSAGAVPAGSSRRRMPVRSSA